MNKRKMFLGLFSGFIIFVALASLLYLNRSKLTTPPIPQNEPTAPELIGGQKDEHGCLIPAGYSWCEVKQKCLRTWEEPCEAGDNYEGWLMYPSKKFGFEIKLPPTWDGYKATESEIPNDNLTSFSFGGRHQPFTIFQIIVYTPEAWQKIPNKSAFKVLSQTENNVYVCDGCCGQDQNYTGGGQFDEFQVARCKEGREIISTFKTLP